MVKSCEMVSISLLDDQKLHIVSHFFNFNTKVTVVCCWEPLIIRSDFLNCRHHVSTRVLVHRFVFFVDIFASRVGGGFWLTIPPARRRICCIGKLKFFSSSHCSAPTAPTFAPGEDVWKVQQWFIRLRTITPLYSFIIFRFDKILRRESIPVVGSVFWNAVFERELYESGILCSL